MATTSTDQSSLNIHPENIEEDAIPIHKPYTIKNVNPGSFYSENLICKVWDVYIKTKELGYYCGPDTESADVDGVVDHLCTGIDGLSLRNAGILLNADKTLYKRNENNSQETSSISICSLVNYTSGNAVGGYDAITSNLKISLEQIKTWKDKHEPEQQITSHIIIFPYHKTDMHWNLGILKLNFSCLFIDWVN